MSDESEVLSFYEINPAVRSEVLGAVHRTAFAAAWRLMPESSDAVERIGFAQASDAVCLAMMLPAGAIIRAGERQ